MVDANAGSLRRLTITAPWRRVQRAAGLLTVESPWACGGGCYVQGLASYPDGPLICETRLFDRLPPAFQ